MKRYLFILSCIILTPNRLYGQTFSTEDIRNQLKLIEQQVETHETTITKKQTISEMLGNEKVNALKQINETVNAEVLKIEKYRGTTMYVSKILEISRMRDSLCHVMLGEEKYQAYKSRLRESAEKAHVQVINGVEYRTIHTNETPK